MCVVLPFRVGRPCARTSHAHDNYVQLGDVLTYNSSGREGRRWKETVG